MCTAVVYDVCATFLAALAEEEEAQRNKLDATTGSAGSAGSSDEMEMPSVPSSISEPAVLREAAEFITTLTQPEPGQ